jgi:hypothetical protein
MKNPSLLIYIFVVFSVSSFIGCNGYVQVKGKVTFADNQSPLTVGTVILQNETHTAKGTIKPNGTFQVSSVKKNDGLPPGVYQVGIIGAMVTPESENSSVLLEDLKPQRHTHTNESLINPKYFNPKTSGIVFDTSKDKELNIVVERY